MCARPPSERVSSLRVALEGVFEARRDEKLDLLRRLEDERAVEYQRLASLAASGDATVVVPQPEVWHAATQAIIATEVTELDARFDSLQVR